MESWLREILCCPICRGEVTGDVNQAAGFLVCAACALQFPVVDGIPVLLSEDAIALGGVFG